MLKRELRKIIGDFPQEYGFKKRMRFHQGWWRAFVLAEEQGDHPTLKSKRVCNTLPHGKISGKNFMSENIRDAVEETLRERQENCAGVIEENRLFNNLLSSQPLCFNFFGEMKTDTNFALQVLQCFYPALTKVNRVIFEYAPIENYTNDNSAFDVAFEVMRENEMGLIGIECKFTDSFSRQEYDKEEYREIYDQSKIFGRRYEEYRAGRYNQLFRNQLMAEGLLQHKKYDFVFTALFCHQDDKQAIKTGEEFQKMLNMVSVFSVITYQMYIEKMQQLLLDWEKRELTMMLWARYCSSKLSEQVS